MILKKPYAFFIKMFKPIHIVLSIMIGFLIYLQSNILIFFNSYIHSNVNVIDQNVKLELWNTSFYIIPIFIIIFSLFIFGIMFKKKKSFLFYLINIFVYIVVIVINVYTSNFFYVLDEFVVSIRTVKLIHDLTLINILIECITFFLFFIRGVGLDFKKFNFNSDLSKIDINESDSEEIEVNVDIDFNEAKRKRKKFFRNLRYIYYEKKFFINLILITSICIISLMVLIFGLIGNKRNIEGNDYSLDGFNMMVESTYMLNTDYKDKKITDNYLIVVNVKLKSNYLDKKLYLNDFGLKIGSAIFKPIKKYSEHLYDLGILYNEDKLQSEYKNYLFVFEIGEKFISSEMLLKYLNDIEIELNPKEIKKKKLNITKNIMEEISFKETLGDLKFKINDYQIAEKFLIEYDYCIKNKDCLKSKEYLKASIDQDFDKSIIKLDVEYNNKSSIYLKKFYDLFDKFGSISYKINDIWYLQNSKFEEINSSKLALKNVVYIGVDSKIMNSSNIKLVFNIRGSKYEYILK